MLFFRKITIRNVRNLCVPLFSLQLLRSFEKNEVVPGLQTISIKTIAFIFPNTSPSSFSFLF